MKRTFDIIVLILATPFFLPIIVLLALVVKMASSGPVFFRQVRIGRNRSPFTILKFRTMVVNAEFQGPLVTSKGDARITPIGRVLRRTKLDELPTLWNVFVGEMSLVGPRPEAIKYVEKYLPEYMRVFNVRPGITDLATLQFRDEESVLEQAIDREKAYFEVVLPIKIGLALDYVERQSLLLDLSILFRTVWGITLGRLFARPDNSLARAAIARIIKFKL